MFAETFLGAFAGDLLFRGLHGRLLLLQDRLDAGKKRGDGGVRGFGFSALIDEPGDPPSARDVGTLHLRAVRRGAARDHIRPRPFPGRGTIKAGIQTLAIRRIPASAVVRLTGGMFNAIATADVTHGRQDLGNFREVVGGDVKKGSLQAASVGTLKDLTEGRALDGWVLHIGLGFPGSAICPRVFPICGEATVS